MAAMRARAVAVEEEYLLVDAGTLRPVPPLRVGAAPPAVHDLGGLRSALVAQRHRTGAAAAAHRALVAAAGTSPFPADARCGCQVRIAVGSFDEAAALPERLAPWLPVLAALAANSPFWAGADTGYASFAAQLRDAPRRQAQGLVRAKVPEQARGHDPGRDRGVEVAVVDVADVALDVDDAVLVAALARALVDTAVRQSRDGVAPMPVRPELIRLATWRASRSGLSGVLVDVTARRVVPARVLVGRLLRHVRNSLDDAGDADVVDELVAALLARGTGAARQREAHRRRGRLEDVVRLLVDCSVPLAMAACP
jgi:glutamate---cysteine ligase / carboxylate-amine ligase